MSIEKSIDNLASAIESLAASIAGKVVAMPTPAPAKKQAAPAKKKAEPKPEVIADPEPPEEIKEIEAEVEAEAEDAATVDLSDLRDLGKKLIKAKKVAEMRDVLSKAGAESLSTLEESKFSEVLTKLKALL